MKNNADDFVIQSISLHELTRVAQKKALVLYGSGKVIAKPHGVGHSIRTVNEGYSLHRHLQDGWVIVDFCK